MTSLILLCYGELGQELLKAAQHIMQQPLSDIQVISVFDHADTVETLNRQLQQAINLTETDRQTLILSDLHGCTHFNIARKLVKPSQLALVSGVNLAMLLRAINHQHDDLLSLSQYAEEGGVLGISTISTAPANEPQSA